MPPLPLPLLLLLLAAGGTEGGRGVAGPGALRTEPAPAAPLARRMLGGELNRPDETHGAGYFWHLPLVSCSNYTQLAALYTLSPSECAVRCAGATTATRTSICNAFMYASYDPVKPVGLPPAPAGQTWARCVLMDNIQLSTCTPKASRHIHLWWGLDLDGVTFDTYLLWMRPVAGPSDWVWGSITVGRLTAAQLPLASPGSAAGGVATVVKSFNAAVTQTLQNRCCASFVELAEVTDVEPAPSVLVRFRARMLVGATGRIPFLQSNLVDALTGAQGEAALLAELQARGINTTNVTVSSSAGAALVCPAPQSPSRDNSWLLRGFAVALTVCTVLLAAALVLVLYRRRGRAAEAASRRTDFARTRPHDVFISYRRQDLLIADSVHDKLTMAGLRVFYDRDGGMAGRPFESELLKAVQGAPLFAVIVSLESLRLWATHRPDKPDYTLAEFVLASHLMHRGVVLRIFPLLVGAWRERPSGGGERDFLPGNAQFQELCATLPAVVPTATLELAASMLEDERRGETLDACFEGATVRDILLGTTKADGAKAALDAQGVASTASSDFKGLLQIQGVPLDGPDEQAGLVLRHRYAENLVKVLREA